MRCLCYCFAMTLQARLEGREPGKFDTDYPTITDGVRGMAFVRNVVPPATATRSGIPLRFN